MTTDMQNTEWRELDNWDSLSKEEKMNVGRFIEKQLAKVSFGIMDDSEDEESASDGEDTPARAKQRKTNSIEFQTIQTFSCGDQSHDIAIFHVGTSKPLLIPGGKEIELGYDYDSDDEDSYPSPEVKREFHRDFTDKHGLPPLEDHLGDVMSSSRRVTLGPFLLDQSPTRMSSCQVVEKVLKGSGWSLPSEDEWEWAYRGGTKAFYPTGNEYTGIGTEDDSEEGGTTGFGFMPPESTYNIEMLSDEGISRGGDGGVIECGGYGGVVWDLIHACAYRDGLSPEEAPDGVYFRKCYRLPKM